MLHVHLLVVYFIQRLQFLISFDLSLNAFPNFFRLQVDWEALLAQRPADFIAAVSPWLLPPNIDGGAAGPVGGKVRAGACHLC